jgi:hypothetical protein
VHLNTWSYHSVNESHTYLTYHVLMSIYNTWLLYSHTLNWKVMLVGLAFGYTNGASHEIIGHVYLVNNCDLYL